MGRIPVERSTLYDDLRRFDTENPESPDPLDQLSDEEVQRFGSYHQLTKLRDFRFQESGRPDAER